MNGKGAAVQTVTYDPIARASGKLLKKFFYKQSGRGNICFDLDQDELAKELGIHIPRDILIMVEGKESAGKSVMAERFAYGFLENNHTVTYISTELTTIDFIHQMKSLGYPIVNHMLRGKLRFFPVYPLQEQTAERNDFLGKLLQTNILYNSEVVVVDSFSSLIINDLDSRRALHVLSFFKRLLAAGKTIMITMDPEELREDVIKPFRATADFYLLVEIRMFGNTAQKMLSLKRFQKSLGRPGEVIAFRVEPELGFIVEILTMA